MTASARTDVASALADGVEAASAEEPPGEPTGEPTGEPNGEPTGEPTSGPTPSVGGPTAEPTSETTASGGALPWLPPGQEVALPGGTVHVRDSGPRADAPTVLLLHGWAVTADLNWFPAYAALAERYRVISFDHRGHGRGLRPDDGMVHLDDCADDAAAVLDALDIDRAVVTGYSMGGAIAQLTWRRHPKRVSGLVLASTSRHFQGGPITDLWYRSYTPLAHVVRRVPGPAKAVVRRRVDRRVQGASSPERARWMHAELVQADPAGLLSSMRSIGRFRSNRWIGEVDVPTAVVVTAKDRTVPTRRQRQLAASIGHAARFEVAGPHDAIVTRADDYVPVLLDAVAHAATTPS